MLRVAREGVLAEMLVNRDLGKGWLLSIPRMKREYTLVSKGEGPGGRDLSVLET